VKLRVIFGFCDGGESSGGLWDHGREEVTTKRAGYRRMSAKERNVLKIRKEN